MQILNFCYLIFVYFFYPETKRLTLEEVAKIFDGDEAKVGRVDIRGARDWQAEKDAVLVTGKQL